ncbi:hypothetical protein PHMEG_00040062, partial [Phytophthora megakarya]
PFQQRDYVAADQFIPHWRLTQPHRDLKDELLERPLLSVFRFVRFSTYFVASARCDTKYTRVTSDVNLCGQVVAYEKAEELSLVDDINLLMEPSSKYVCYVALRHYADELRQVVAIPLEDVRVCHISQAEYVLGHHHALPKSMDTSGFNPAWTSIELSAGRSASEAIDRVASAFVVPGTPPVTTVDLSPRPVAYITPLGEKTSATVTDYVLATKTLTQLVDVGTDAIGLRPWAIYTPT